MNKAVLIQSYDWETLYINGKAVLQGHTLNEGYDRGLFFNRLSKEYNFNLDDLKIGFVSDEYDNRSQLVGSFDNNLEDVEFKYVS